MISGANTFFCIARFLLLLAFFVQVKEKAFAQLPPKFWQQSNELLRMLDKYHYSPVSIDAKASEEIFTNAINSLDPYGLYFTRQDLALFEKHKSTFVDELKEQGALNTEISKKYREVVLRADSLVDELTKKPFDFNRQDTVFFTHKRETNYTADLQRLKKRWEKNLKFQALELLFTAQDENDKPLEKDNKTLLQKEAEVRSKVQSRNKKSLKKILSRAGGLDNYVDGVILNAIATRFDPHSSFFSPVEKSDFQQQLSSEALSFGIAFDENDKNEIAVLRLLPGGAAWKSNQLSEGDVLVKIKFADGKTMDAAVNSIAEFEQAIEKPENKKAEFTVKKNNGQVKTVSLVKDKIVAEDNVVKSYVLKGERKIGYISLPSFYTQWENTGRLGCANDVAKELIKLQEEKIDGLILDVRDNGGGSVQEALDLAGIFIDEGPLGIYKTKDSKPLLLKDLNRGTIYDGPLVLMVNGYSASASELLAAALQDYKRAVIAGSITYGKATGQTILPLDAMQELNTYGGKELNSDLGYVKVTFEKFYRVTNDSHQKKGIAPDVKLPEFRFSFSEREAGEKFVLPSDSVVKKVVYTPYPELPLKELAAASAGRVEKSAAFKQISAFVDSVNKSGAEEALILKPDEFRKYSRQQQRALDAFDVSDTTATNIFKATNNAYDEKVVRMDEYAGEMNTEILEDIQTDIYIEEAYRVIGDLIRLTKK